MPYLQKKKLADDGFHLDFWRTMRHTVYPDGDVELFVTYRAETVEEDSIYECLTNQIRADLSLKLSKRKLAMDAFHTDLWMACYNGLGNYEKDRISTLTWLWLEFRQVFGEEAIYNPLNEQVREDLS